MSIRMYCLHFFFYTLFFLFLGTYKEQLLRYAIVTYVQKLGETFAEEHDMYHISYFSLLYFKLYWESVDSLFVERMETVLQKVILSTMVIYKTDRIAYRISNT